MHCYCYTLGKYMPIMIERVVTCIIIMMIRQFIRRRNISMKSLQGRRTSGSRDKCRTAPDGRQTLDQAHGLEPLARLKAAMKLHPPSPSLLLSPEADTHFTIPQRVEGSVDLDGWLYTQTVYLPVNSHHPSSNRAQCRLTSLINPTR